LERADFIVEPHFKGIVDARDASDIGLVTGADAFGNPLDAEQILRLLETSPSVELITDVRRAIASALYALDEQRKHGSRPRLACPEGCPHRVGYFVFRGAQIMQELWRSHVPQTEEELDPPILDYYSDCTSREVERVMGHLAEGGRLIVITDAYQVGRSYDYLRRFRRPGQTTLVHTPEDIQGLLSQNIDARQREFFNRVVEIVQSRFSRERVFERERKAERQYRLLHALASVLNVVHPSFDLERSMAALLRGDARLRRQLFSDDVEPIAPPGGLPPRERDDGGVSDFFTVRRG
jgi:hypothetical protein